MTPPDQNEFQDMSQYEDWTVKDCYEADKQITLLYNRCKRLQDKLDKLGAKGGK